MDKLIFKAVRLPRTIIKQLERVAKVEGSTFSQILRTAAIRDLEARKKRAA